MEYPKVKDLAEHPIVNPALFLAPLPAEQVRYRPGAKPANGRLLIA